MKKLLLAYQDDTLSAEVDAEKKFLKATWLKHPSSPEFRKAAQLLMELVREHQIHYLLSDCRRVQFLDISDQNFLLRQIYAAMPPDWTLSISYILNQASYNLMDIYRIGEMVQADDALSQHLKTNLFLDEAAAMYWLLGSEA